MTQKKEKNLAGNGNSKGFQWASLNQCSIKGVGLDRVSS